MATAASPSAVRRIHQHENATEEPGPEPCTLLQVVEAIGEVTPDDDEVVATVVHMLRSGSICLTGNFHDKPLSDFDEGSNA